jgi:hypothetical protein
MLKKISIIQWLAWFYAANFLSSHWPGLTDAQGRLLGLFYIDPIDDIFHFVSGIIAAVVAWHSYRWSVNYFKIAGIPYGLDAITGIFFSREFLNGDVFVRGLGGTDFTMRAFLVNAQHILILITMLWIGFWLSKRVSPKSSQVTSA